MKVHELIAKLEKMDRNAEVFANFKSVTNVMITLGKTDERGYFRTNAKGRVKAVMLMQWTELADGEQHEVAV